MSAITAFALLLSFPTSLNAGSPAPAESAKAIGDLRKALEKPPEDLSSLAEQKFAKVPLTRADAAEARALLVKAHQANILKTRGEELKNRKLKLGKLEMPFAMTTFGKKPAAGWSLYISMHGGGNAPAAVNDQQWENQKKLYQPEEGIYLSPRAPTNTWNLWHEGHIDDFFERLIEDLIAIESVNPDRVFILGYSAGGDGVYQLAPRMADHFAAASMMAGHPNGVSLLSLRNLPFALQCGGKDSAYSRNRICAEYGAKLDEYRKDDPKGYEHLVKIYEKKGHWMDLEDRIALPWMARFTRNPTPDRIVWHQTSVAKDRFYWLTLPKDQVKANTTIIVEKKKQTVVIEKKDGVDTVVIRLDDRMLDLDQPVKVTYAGKTLLEGNANRTIAVMLRTLAGRGDPKLIFDAELYIDFGANK